MHAEQIQPANRPFRIQRQQHPDPSTVVGRGLVSRVTSSPTCSKRDDALHHGDGYMPCACRSNTFLTGAEHTIAHLLRSHGYVTGFVGKYHLGFPLSASQRRGRATFGGAGRGLNYSELARTVQRFGGFDEALAVWGGNKQTARSPHHPEWMAAEASAFIHRAAASRRRFFLYFAPTVPHAPFVLPDALLANASVTPAGVTDDGRAALWQQRRSSLLSKLMGLGLVCRDYGECHELNYSGAEGRHNVAYRAPVALNERWLSRAWLHDGANFEQLRLARAFMSGLAWLDESVGDVLNTLKSAALRRDTLVIATADHGASFLGKGHAYEAGVRVPLMVSWPAALPRGVRSRRVATLLDIAPSLTAVASAMQASSPSAGGMLLSDPDVSFHGQSGLFSSPPDEVDERPVFFEVGYLRAVLQWPWKLLLINDVYDRCNPTASGCRNLHGQLVEVSTAMANSSGAKRYGLGSMTYDAPARHAAFCDRQQLYNLEVDPLEEHNVIDAHPVHYKELLRRLQVHVQLVEASNPAGTSLGVRQCALAHSRRSGVLNALSESAT